MIVYGLMYFICIPSGYLLLTIYSLVNMNNVSWGTRETKEGEGEAKKKQNILCDKDCQLCCWDMKIQITQETEKLMIPLSKGLNAMKSPALLPNQETPQEEEAKTEPPLKVEKLVEEKEDKDMKGDQERKGSTSASSSSSNDSIKKPSLSDVSDDEDSDEDTDDEGPDEIEERPIGDWVNPVKEVFLKKLTPANIKRNLQAQIRYTLRNKDQDDVCEDLILMLTDTLNGELSGVGPEDVLNDARMEELSYALKTQARHFLKTCQMTSLDKRVKRAIEKTLTAPQVPKLDEEEYDFWGKLIERYLKPIVDSEEHKNRVQKELKSLRNKAVFLYFIINVLWVVATFFLQAIGNDVISIKIPKLHTNGTPTGEFLLVEPLSLMFLISFAILLIIQFLAMLYHRVYTLIHVVSYRSSEKDYQKRDEDEEDDEDTNIFSNDFAITSDDL